MVMGELMGKVTKAPSSLPEEGWCHTWKERLLKIFRTAVSSPRGWAPTSTPGCRKGLVSFEPVQGDYWQQPPQGNSERQKNHRTKHWQRKASPRGNLQAFNWMLPWLRRAHHWGMSHWGANSIEGWAISERDTQSENWVCTHLKGLCLELPREIPGRPKREMQDPWAAESGPRCQIEGKCRSQATQSHGYLHEPKWPTTLSDMYTPSAAWRSGVREEASPSRCTVGIPVPQQPPQSQTVAPKIPAKHQRLKAHKGMHITNRNEKTYRSEKPWGRATEKQEAT